MSAAHDAELEDAACARQQQTPIFVDVDGDRLEVSGELFAELHAPDDAPAAMVPLCVCVCVCV